jgi:AcrR family transcriptional regulator
MEDSQDTRNKIFAIAAHLFAQKGYNGVSMREISEKTGVSKPTIYYYFGSKEEIYTELVRTGLEHGGEHLSRIRAQQSTLEQKLIDILKVRLQLCYDHPDFAKFFLIIVTMPEQLPFLDKLKQEPQRKRCLLKKILEEAKTSGELPYHIDTEIATDIFAGITFQYIRKILSGEDNRSIEEISRKAIEMMFTGLN